MGARCWLSWGLLLAQLPGCAPTSSSFRPGAHWGTSDYALREHHPAPPPIESTAMTASHVGAKTAPSASSTNRPERAAAPPGGSLSRPGSPDCQDELSARGLSFRPLSDLRGVEDPIEVTGQLGGIEFWANDGRSLQLDCRLALSLDDMRPVFEHFSVKRIRYSGAYVYRTTRSGRLSHHAYGLAIDLHDIETSDQQLSVKRDFSTGTTCAGRAPTLNRLACALRSAGDFEEFLTPDYNADHRDHLHLGVALENAAHKWHGERP